MIVFQLKLFTTIHKHYTVEQWKEFAAQNSGILQVRILLLVIFIFKSRFRMWQFRLE